jgi:hypothetical protein
VKNGCFSCFVKNGLILRVPEVCAAAGCLYLLLKRAENADSCFTGFAGLRGIGARFQLQVREVLRLMGIPLICGSC